DRVSLFNDIATCIINNNVSIRFVEIDVNWHRKKYTYPEPEYKLGLQLILERFCDFLDNKNDLGLVFCDYEKDQVTNAILDFSQFKQKMTTPMVYGRPLGRIIDTIYFTQSHHSRFLQAADVMCFLAQRFERKEKAPQKWHEQKCLDIWELIKNNTDFEKQVWGTK
ncbi:MAG: DUF3800 domain-containing protein, partial [Cyanobacteria bacterium P01_F01_bin.143]